ncbi:hypothetical protein Tco_0760648, partial [Tanacetum coccineum]
MAQQIIPATQLVPKFQGIGRCNNYVVLQSIQCSPECKIEGRILPDHPLSYALTVIADLDTQDIVYNVDMFRDTLKLSVETLENPFVAPVNIEIIESFMHTIGYQGVVDIVSAFFTKFLAQPCRTNVDYATLLWWDFVYCKYPSISLRLEEDYHSIKDDIPLEIRATDDYKEYESMFVSVVVPIVSTQGTHRTTPRAHRTPTLTIASPQGKKRKQSVGETSSPQKSLKVTIKQKQVVEDRIEPRSHKEYPKVVDDDDENKEEKKDEKKDDDMGSLENGTEKMQTPIPTTSRSPRTNLSLDKNIDQELTVTVSPSTATTSKYPHKKRRISSKYSHLLVHGKVYQVLYEIIPQLAERATNDLIEGNLKRVVADTIIQERDAFQSKRKFEQSSISNTSCRDDKFHSQKHDDHQKDDAPLEGEKRVKRHKTSKSSKSAREETAIDEDEVIPEDETPDLITEFENVDKYVPTISDRARMEATLNDMLSNQFRNYEEYSYHLEQATNFMENQIVWESRQEDIRRPIPKPLIIYGS